MFPLYYREAEGLNLFKEKYKDSQGMKISNNSIDSDKKSLEFIWNNLYVKEGYGREVKKREVQEIIRDCSENGEEELRWKGLFGGEREKRKTHNVMKGAMWIQRKRTQSKSWKFT